MADTHVCEQCFLKAVPTSVSSHKAQTTSATGTHPSGHFMTMSSCARVCLWVRDTGRKSHPSVCRTINMMHHLAQPVKLERDLRHRLSWCMWEHVVLYVENIAGSFQLWFGVPAPLPPLFDGSICPKGASARHCITMRHVQVKPVWADIILRQPKGTGGLRLQTHQSWAADGRQGTGRNTASWKHSVGVAWNHKLLSWEMINKGVLCREQRHTTRKLKLWATPPPSNLPLTSQLENTFFFLALCELEFSEMKKVPVLLLKTQEVSQGDSVTPEVMGKSCISGSRRLSRCCCAYTEPGMWQICVFWRCFCYVLFNGFSLFLSLCVSADCSPVQFDASLLLQLSPQLVALLHHAGVEVMVVGLADDAGLAMGAASAVGQDELGKRN